jgi:hypothetical protein
MSGNAAAEELYGLPPDEFMAARDALAKAAGDREAARAIKALRKPSLAAWALNQLVRQQRPAVEELIALGDDLRQAQERLAGDELRALGRQRHQLVRAVAGQAADLARTMGRPLSPAVVEQVARSLDAALTDRDNAALLLSGQLSAALGYAGLGEPRGPALTLVREAKPAEAGTQHRKAAERARAKEFATARAAVAAAERDFAQAEGERVHAREVLAAAHLRAGIALERLENAREEWEHAQADEDSAVTAERVAARSSEIASLRLEQARHHADGLAP